MATAVKDARTNDWCGHEHDWCEIPLHEDACICVLCGEIREAGRAPSSWGDTPDYLLAPPLTFSI